MTSNQLIIGVTGLPSSGKGEFSNIAHQEGFHVEIMGDVIRNEVKKRGLQNTRENQNQIMVLLREEHGTQVVAEITLDNVKRALNAGENKILIDGLRSMDEVTLFRSEFENFMIIAIHASPKTRYERARNRNREDDAYSLDSFNKRDKIELDVGLGNVIALADIVIPSEMDLEESHILYHEILQQLMKSKLEMNN